MPVWKQLDCLTRRHGCSLDEWNCTRPWRNKKKKKKRHCRQCPSCLTCRRPFYTDFTITFLFVLFSQTKALETVEKLRSKHCSNISKHATFILHSLMLLFRWRDIKPWYNTLIRLKLKYQVTDKPNNLAGILPQPFELR